MHKSQSAQHVYDAHVARAANVPRLILQRNVAAAGSVTSLLVILQLLQVGVEVQLLQYALTAASIALPLFIAASAIYQAHIAAGRVTYAHLAARHIAVLLGLVQFIAGALLIFAVGFCIWQLSPRSGAVFALACGMSGVILIVAHFSMLRHLARNPDGRDEPGGDD